MGEVSSYLMGVILKSGYWSQDQKPTLKEGNKNKNKKIAVGQIGYWKKNH